MGDYEFGGRRTEATATEKRFLDALFNRPKSPVFDVWLHEDADGTPWLIVSLDFVEGNVAWRTLRLDFDGREVKGGWSPAGLNWDDGVRALDAEVDTEPPDGVADRADDPEELARVAGEWFERHLATRDARGRPLA